MSASALYADTYHLVSPTTAAVTPGGETLQTASTSNSGFTPTKVLNGTTNYWYGPLLTGSYAAGSWSLLTWNNQPGCASNVTAEIGYSDNDGSNFVSLGTQTIDVNASGPGNHTTNFAFAVPFLNINNKRLRISLVRSSGCDSVIAYNAGVDFDSRLITTAFGPSGTPTRSPTSSPSPTPAPTLEPAVIKSVDNASPLLGDTITYTLTFRNPNPNNNANCSDDFEAGTDWPAGWSAPTGGTWGLAADNGPTAGGSNALDATETGGFHYSILQCVNNVTDGSIQADVKIMTAAGKVTQLWRQNGSSTYQFHVEEGSAGNISLRVITNGAFLELAVGNHLITQNTWFVMRFVVTGFSLQGYINGALVLSATDPNVTYNSGGAGLEIDDPGTTGMHARFDNVIINKNSLAWYNVTMTDTLPAGLSYVSSTGGGTASGQTVSFNLGTITAQATGTRLIVAQVNSCGSALPNTADLEVGLPAQHFTSNLINVTPLCASPTYTRTPSRTATRTTTPTSSSTSTATPSASSTSTRTSTVTPTQTPTSTNSSSQTPSRTQTSTSTVSPSSTDTSTRTATPSSSATPTTTSSSTDTVTSTASATRTSTSTNTATATETQTRTQTPTRTVTSTSSSTATPTDSRTVTPSSTETRVVSFTNTATATPTYTSTPSFSASPTSSSTASTTQSSTPTPSSTSSPSASSTGTITATPSSSATPTVSVTRSNTPTTSVSSTGTTTYSATPSVTGTRTASPSATQSPTQSVSPTASPSPLPMPFQVRANIYNAAGELVRHLYEGSFSSVGLRNRLSQDAMQAGQAGCALILDGKLPDGSSSIAIEGRNDQGQLLSGGSYIVKWESSDPFGQIQTFQMNLVVLPAQSPGNLGIFSSSGELIASLPLPAGLIDLSDFSLSNGSVAISGQGVGLDLRDSKGQTATQLWDGRNAQGLAVSSGTYIVRALGGSAQGQGKVWSVQVIQAPGSLLEPVLAPNPAPVTATELRLFVGPGLGLSAHASLHSLSGELVVEAHEHVPGQLALPLRKIAGGVYVVSIEQVDSLGQVHRWRKKVAILR